MAHGGGRPDSFIEVEEVMTETDIESSLLGNVPVCNESSTFIAD